MATPILSTATAISRDRPAAEQARAIATVLLEGFNKHYALFRECARAAKRHFEAGSWLAIQHVGRDRIDFYDRRVHETADRILRDFGFAALDNVAADALWEQVKLHFIGLLLDHKQPECAETFFNSVSVKTLRRGYFHNRLIFIRPAISTEHIDADPPSYRSYYPLQQGLRHALIDTVSSAHSPISGATCVTCLLRSARAAPVRFASNRTTRSRCCRRRSSATRRRTSSVASSTASTATRSSCRSGTMRRASSTSMRS
jgi:hypothetical protein